MKLDILIFCTAFILCLNVIEIITNISSIIHVLQNPGYGCTFQFIFDIIISVLSEVIIVCAIFVGILYYKNNMNLIFFYYKFVWIFVILKIICYMVYFDVSIVFYKTNIKCLDTKYIIFYCIIFGFSLLISIIGKPNPIENDLLDDENKSDDKIKTSGQDP